MRLGSVFIATSLDGFIARSDGAIDWLDRASAAAPPGEDFGYKKFFDSCDAMLLGRKTYELARSFDPWPYGKKRLVVLSSGNPDVPASIADTVSTSSEAPEALSKRLASEGVRRVYVDGGRTIQSFLRARLIADMTITVIPVLLGSGIPLFGSLERDVELRLVSSTAFECGFAQLTYRVE